MGVEPVTDDELGDAGRAFERYWSERAPVRPDRAAVAGGRLNRVFEPWVRPSPCCLPWRRLARWKKSLACMRVEANTRSMAKMLTRRNGVEIWLDIVSFILIGESGHQTAGSSYFLSHVSSVP